MEPNDEEFDDSLEHIGIKRRSGRYPWGSGDNEYERSKGFKAYYEDLKSKGLTDTQIAEGIGMYAAKSGHGDPKDKFTTFDLRAATAISTETIYAANQARAYHLVNDKGLSVSAAARVMSTEGKRVNESTVRGWLKGPQGIKEGSLRATANRLKEEVDAKEFLDVGKGTHLYMGIAETKLNTALAMLRDEGYNLYSNIRLPQLGTDKMTTYKVLTKAEKSWHDAKEAVKNGLIRTVAAQSDDNGQTFKRAIKDEPVSVDLKRIEVAYKEDGGHTKDGVIELRRGVDDLSLGANNYAQVRIGVNGTHYLKGMAMYADDLPKGVDIRFNTNKSKDDPKILADGKLGAMKPFEKDPENRFGVASNAKPRIYTDKQGKEKTSPINILNEEGQWDEWSKSLSSQMLSKQSLSLASSQLGKAQTKRAEELKKISGMTNKVVKEKLLMEFADQADAAAVHLKAAALDRQATNVILPMNSMRRHEIYAPNFNNGEKVVLVRHPHGGPFEIPELTVNNNNSVAKRILRGAKDAVGIHHSVAEQLSGADFDGDTVLVIPNDRGRIKTRPPLEKLKNFDPKVEYKIPDDDTSTRRMSKQDTQREMGRISNLITDMTIHKASDDEIARAVRHSMVVIDAEKHGLNYKQSEQDHNISQLKAKYQGGANRGASTIISRAGATARVPKQKQLSGAKGIDPRTGEKVFVKTGETYQRPIRDKNGNPTGKYETVVKTTKGTKMEFADDARRLLSGGDIHDKVTADRGQPIERIYADYANSMKALANQARKEQVSLTMPRQSPAAKGIYHREVDSLRAKLRLAHQNAPLERRAQSIGRASFNAKVDANPGLDKDHLKKLRYQSLEEARTYTGANKQKVHISDREWEAIQAGAVSTTTLREILRSADMDRVRDLATPRARTSFTPGQLIRAKQMRASGRTLTEIADQLGIPRSTVALRDPSLIP